MYPHSLNASRRIGTEGCDCCECHFNIVGIQFSALLYSPSTQIPTQDDLTAHTEVLKRISEETGTLMSPSNPFLAYKATGSLHTHQMGIKDVGYLGGLADLPKVIAQQKYRTILTAHHQPLPNLDKYYYQSSPLDFPTNNALRMKTGYLTRVNTLWFRVMMVREPWKVGRVRPLRTTRI